LGMKDAVLEPGIMGIIAQLSKKYHLLLLTNNKQANAELVLSKFALNEYFYGIVGRDNVKLLKPEPEGFYHIFSFLPDLKKNNFLAIGDAMIDFQAAQAAEIKFLAYCGNRCENWQDLSVKPLDYLYKWDENAIKIIDNILLCD
ncbi:MAG: HAD-IA family hydrolase, partial [Clostridiales bacterium]